MKCYSFTHSKGVLLQKLKKLSAGIRSQTTPIEGRTKF